MSSAFDDKVYEYIKTNSSGGGGGGGGDITFDDIYPVGSVVRRNSKSPPSSGTWVLKGIHGQHMVDKTVDGIDLIPVTVADSEETLEAGSGTVDSETTVHHRLVFNGAYVIDYICVLPTDSTWMQWDYTSIFGQNYNFQQTTDLTYSTSTSGGWNAGVVDSEGNHVNISWLGNVTQGEVLRINKGDKAVTPGVMAGVTASIMIYLFDSLDNYDLSTFSELTYEYERTN